MIKKIIHIADIHLRTLQRHDEYRAAFDVFCGDITELLSDFEYNEARIAIVGDLVHQKITISNEQTAFLTWLLNKLAAIAPVVIIAGNHDLLEENKDRMDTLTPIIDIINNPNINYLKTSKCVFDENITWVPYSIFEGNKRPNIEDSRLNKPENTIVGLFHAPVFGAKTDLGFQFDATSITNMSHFTGCDMVLLGDIHKVQCFDISEYLEIDKSELDGYSDKGWVFSEVIEDEKVKVRRKTGIAAYSGSLIQQNFGETVKGHGFLIWDVSNGDYTHHEVESDYKYYQFKINSASDIEEGKEILTNG